MLAVGFAVALPCLGVADDLPASAGAEDPEIPAAADLPAEEGNPDSPAVAEPPVALPPSQQALADELDDVYRDACMSVVTIRAANEVESDFTTGFFVADDGLIATVYAGETLPNQVAVAHGGVVYEGVMVAYDPKTRLALVRAEGLVGEPLKIAMSDEVDLGQLVAIVTESADPLKRLLPARLAGREKHFRGRILPVTLMRLNLAVEFPTEAFGAPVLTEDGHLVGVLLLEIPGDQSAIYALPSEIVDKVKQNYLERGKIGYGWIGITLEEGTTTPRILECYEGSPAAAAGLTTGDVVLAANGKQIDEYQDVVDASYFLTPGEPVKIKILRGTRVIEMTLTPIEREVQENSASGTGEKRRRKSVPIPQPAE